MRTPSAHQGLGGVTCLGIGALLLAGGACRGTSVAGGLPIKLTDGGPVAQVQVRTYVEPTSSRLDVLFVIDDAPSSGPLQRKLQAQLGAFVDGLVDPATGKLPDLHIAVVSTSFGAGAWSNVSGCGGGSHPGDDRGFFQQGPGGAGMGTCSMLHAGARFLSTGDATTPATYNGDLRDALKCIALLGETGCPYRSTFESTYYALYYASQKYGVGPDSLGNPSNTDNGGFLRPDAKLGIVMVTNGDDCSVSSDSLLFDPTPKAGDPGGVGAATPYRCNEFGHLCGGQPPPHVAPAAPVTLASCVSAENDGKTDTGLTDPSGCLFKTFR